LHAAGRGDRLRQRQEPEEQQHHPKENKEIREEGGKELLNRKMTLLKAFSTN
jgi:hypothetical protein